MKKRPNVFVRLPGRIFSMILILILVPSIGMMYFIKGHMEKVLHSEIDGRIVQSLQQSEGEIDQLFFNITNISNTFLYNSEFTETFSNPEANNYQRYTAFHNVLSGVTMQNLFQHTADDTTALPYSQFKVTFFDNRGDIYASWSLSFQDYSYLAEQPWMKDENVSPGYIIWNTHAIGYMPRGEGARYDQLAMARTIRPNLAGQEDLGTLLISIDQAQIARILSDYKYAEDDIVFASTPDEEVLFVTDDDREIAVSVAERYSRKSRGSDIVSVGNARYLLSYYTVNSLYIGSGRSLKIFYLTDYGRLSAEIGHLMTRINLSCVAFAVLVLLIAVWISLVMSRPIKQLAGEMQRYRPGDVPDLTETNRLDEIGDITRAYRGMALNIHELLIRVKQEQETRERYRFEWLRSKMSPHFLFNTLTSIRYMAIIRNADNIRDGIDSLAAILRYSLSDDGEMVPLSREVEVIRSYCEIHNLRTGCQVRLEVGIDEEALCLSVIKFILQPAVENCFKHAFKGVRADGLIRIDGERQGDRLTLRVCDNGLGFPSGLLSYYHEHRHFPAAGQEADSVRQKSGGLGLDIIDQRIRIGYGEDCGIEPGVSPLGGAMLVYHLRVISEEGGRIGFEAGHDRG